MTHAPAPARTASSGRLGRILGRLGLPSRELRAWAMYDWANSAFATTIMAAVLPIYFVSVAGADLPGNRATNYWAYTSAASLLVIALASPLLGAMSDYLGARKRFLAAFMLLGASGTAALWFVERGDWALASMLFLVGNVGFAGSLVFNDALLPHIAPPEEVDRASAAGYALGYLGGGILLIVNLLMIQMPGAFGFADAAEGTRWAFVTVGIWWAIFSIPVLRSVPEPPRELRAGETGREHPVRVAFGRLRETFGEIRQYPDLFRFLIAYWLYADGIGTIIKMATAYGTEIGIGQSDLIGALLLVQFVGIPFTFAFGALAGRLGAKRGIYLALAVYTVISIAGYWVSQPWHFWALALAVGMVQGGAQALSRSLYAVMIPPGKSSEFFGFFSVSEKFAGIAGPLLFGIVGQVTGTSRLGILALIVFFVGGMILLAPVDVERGRRAAMREEGTLRPAHGD